MDPVSIALMLAGKFAPDIIKYLTKSETAGSVATEVIEIAKKVTGQPDGEVAMSALDADPALQVQFKTAVMESEERIELAYLSDVQSARDRDVKLAEAGFKNIRANIIAGAAFLLVIVCLFVLVVMSDMSGEAKTGISLILGRALGWVEQVFSFEFGTTRNSQVKDATIKNLSR